jgi:hypothetical protein
MLSGAYLDELNASLTDWGAGTLTPRPYVSYRADGFFRVSFLDFLALQLEVGFGPVGGAVLASNGLDRLVGVSANEISVPLLAVFSLRTPFGTFSLLGGGFAAYSIGDPLLIENNGLVRTAIGLVPAFYAGLVGGLGYQIKVGPGEIVADVRYTHRLMSIASEDTAVLTPLAVQLTVGYMLTFGK